MFKFLLDNERLNTINVQCLAGHFKREDGEIHRLKV